MCRKLALILENATWFVKKWLQAIKEQENQVTLKKKQYFSYTHTYSHTQSCIGRKKNDFRYFFKKIKY